MTPRPLAQAPPLRLAAPVSCVMEESTQKVRSRNWCLVLYPDDETHVNCISILESSGYQYCGILHDRDIYDDTDTTDTNLIGTPKKPHYHIVITLKNPRFREPIAQELGIKPNYLEVCRNRDAALLYMVHDGYPNKFQYEIDSLFGPLASAVNKLLADENESARVLRVLDVLDTLPVPVSYRTFLTRCCELDLYGDFRRMGSGIIRLLDEHNQAHWVDVQYRKDMNDSRIRAHTYAHRVDPFDALPRLNRQNMLHIDEEI